MYGYVGLSGAERPEKRQLRDDSSELPWTLRRLAALVEKQEYNRYDTLREPDMEHKVELCIMALLVVYYHDTPWMDLCKPWPYRDIDRKLCTPLKELCKHPGLLYHALYRERSGEERSERLMEYLHCLGECLHPEISTYVWHAEPGRKGHWRRREAHEI